MLHERTSCTAAGSCRQGLAGAAAADGVSAVRSTPVAAPAIMGSFRDFFSPDFLFGSFAFSDFALADFFFCVFLGLGFFILVHHTFEVLLERLYGGERSNEFIKCQGKNNLCHYRRFGSRSGPEVRIWEMSRFASNSTVSCAGVESRDNG